MLRTVLIATALAFAPTAFAASAEKPSPARLEQIVQYYVDQQHFAGSVLVARDDQLLFAKSHGLADREWQIPNTSTT